MAEGPIGEQELLNRVYKGPNKTGDTVDVLAVLPYAFDGINSVRALSGLFNKPYDEFDWSNADVNGNYQTLTTKLAGATANVFAVTYDASGNQTNFKRTT